MNLKYKVYKMLLNSTNKKRARAVIVCDKENESVSLSIKNVKVKYKWENDALKYNSIVIDIYPECAETFIKNQINDILSIENIASDETLICRPNATRMDKIEFSPKCLSDFNKKEAIDKLYSEYLKSYVLDSSIIEKAKLNNIEKEILSLVHLKREF